MRRASFLASAIFLAALMPALAQLNPALSPGGISGAVGGGQAAGAQVPAAPLPPAHSTLTAPQPLPNYRPLGMSSGRVTTSSSRILRAPAIVQPSRMTRRRAYRRHRR